MHRIALASVILLATAPCGFAAPGTAKLSEELEPLRKLPAADRETKMCADSAKILELANAQSKDVPAGVPIDKSTWALFVGDIANSADMLNLLCARKSHSQKSPTDGTLLTAANEISVLYESLDALVEVSKPRTLSPSFSSARNALEAIDWKSSKFCAQAKASAASFEKLQKPAAVAQAAWDALLVNVQKAAHVTQATACEQGKHEPEEVAGLKHTLASAFYKLVLLVPPT